MTDVRLSVLVHPEDAYEWSTVLLAKANFDGTLVLLTRAWERLLGYGCRELDGKALRNLMAAEREADSQSARVAAIFDERSMASVELTLRCRSGGRKLLRLHRRLDVATGAIHIVGEERVSSIPSSAPGAGRRGAPANRRSAAPPPPR